MPYNRIVIAFLMLVASFSASLDGAGPITNSYFAHKFLERGFLNGLANRKAFVAGVLFPDIRYILDDFKSMGPEGDISLDQVMAQSSPFMSGVYFHGFLNYQRDLYHTQTGYYDSLVKAAIASPNLTTQFWEDEVLYTSKGWKTAQPDAAFLYLEEKNSGLAELTLRNWHKMMAASFAFPPSQFLLVAVKLKRSFGPHPANELNIILGNLKKLASDPRHKAQVHNLGKFIEDQFDQYKLQQNDTTK